MTAIGRHLPMFAVAAALAGIGCQVLLGTEERRARPDGGDPDGGDPDGEAARCPAEMVEIPITGDQPFCMDRYEASRSTSDPMLPASVAGAEPWTDVDNAGAAAACARVDKRLCTIAEAEAACAGAPPGRAYPYGDSYQASTCNGADLGLAAAGLTGALAGCEGGVSGLFDLSGNVAEWLADCGLTDGSFTCDESNCCGQGGGSYLSADYELGCAAIDHLALDIQNNPQTGFRCCRTPAS